MATPVFLTRSPLTLPSVDSPDFLRRLKTLIDYREGQTTDQGGRFVTLEQLQVMGLITSVSSPIASVTGGDTYAPNPPTDLVITNKIITHNLSWTNPIDDDLSHIEVWRSTSQDRFNAELVAIATAPTEQADIPGIDQTTSYYYWVRAVDTSGNHSVWNPTDQQGGELVVANVEGEIASIVSKLTGQITDSLLYSTLQTKINGSATAVTTHSGILNDLTAEHYVKVDVNGRVSGFGLYNDGATSDFIINADKFAIITPGSPAGTVAKVPFIVGVVDGVSTVGINGQLVVDGTIRGGSIIANSIASDKIGAGEIKAVNIEANAITGDKIAATSEILLNEGGMLTVGNNNIILDSWTNEVIIAPDNGTVIGEKNLTGHDYCSLQDGDINFMYWTGVAHTLYNSVKRVEVGLNVQNNAQVTIPGIWKKEPNIMVSPANIQTFNKNYVSANQSIICGAESVVRDGLTYKFTPKASLVLADAVFSRNPGLSISQSGMASKTWHYYTTATATTITNVNQIILSGSAHGSAVGDSCNDFCYIQVWMYVDGVETYLGQWYDRFPVANINQTINVDSGVHTYYFKLGYYWVLEGDGFCIKTAAASLSITSETVYLSTFNQLVSGTLNYMAIGE